MTADTLTPARCDPEVPDWGSIELPKTRVDEYDFRRPDHLVRVIREVFGKRRKSVELPEDMPGRDLIPKYVLQEFHNIPNGNYSQHFTRGYVTGFDRMMLGVMTSAREYMAKQLGECQSVLDAGCSGGKTAAALRQVGIADVWGLDVSPYLLQHAARDHENIKFIHALAEDTGFPSERFDGIAASFLFHELPPRFAKEALAEFYRILRPGGLLTICEPSPTQLDLSLWNTLREYGVKGFYYAALARWAFEPFVVTWHKLATKETFQAQGFEVLEDKTGMPLRQILLRKPKADAP